MFGALPGTLFRLFSDIFLFFLRAGTGAKYIHPWCCFVKDDGH
jgi:hypothetical protein